MFSISVLNVCKCKISGHFNANEYIPLNVSFNANEYIPLNARAFISYANICSCGHTDIKYLS